MVFSTDPGAHANSGRQSLAGQDCRSAFQKPDVLPISSRDAREKIGSSSVKATALAFTARTSGNLLLDALSSQDLVDIERDVEIVMMRAHQPSLSADQPMRHVHFPIDAVLSIIVTLSGRSVEVGTIGNESFVEADAALGAVLAARSTICQVEGRVGRMPIEIFKERLASASFALLMRRNVGAALYCTQQYLACNAMHATLNRCARWLLMTADRAGRSQFPLNPDFLGIMLSVHEDEMRAVTDELVHRGAISYSKAILSILDTTLLAQITCECYASCKLAYAKALSD